ncbi:hypothetical protein Tco_0127657 [Tanacetum coccineum]
MDNSKRIDDFTEKFSVFEVNYDGVFFKQPLRYEYGKVLSLTLSNSNRMSYSEMLDMLVYKLECEIRAISLSFILKRKGKSRVKFTRKRAILKRSKMLSLRKRVRSHNVKAGVAKINAGRLNYRSLVSFIGLNEDVCDDEPQLATQLSQTGGSSNNDFKDVD